jgi:hypothetical protein
MSLVTSAICSFCEEYAEFRIGNNDYELHACPPHEETAIFEFNAVEGTDSWRLETHSSDGFRAPIKITYDGGETCS